jgi:hypothetical protein
MIAEIGWFGVCLLLLLATMVCLVYWLFPGQHLSGAKKFERRIEYFILALGFGICLLMLLLMT